MTHFYFRKNRTFFFFFNLIIYVTFNSPSVGITSEITSSKVNPIEPSKELTKPVSPFEMSIQDLLKYNLKIEQELAEDDLKFLELEKNLEDEKKMMDPDGQKAKEAVVEIMTQFKSLTPEVKKAYLGNTIDKLPDNPNIKMEIEKLNALVKSTEEMENKADHFIANVDGYIQSSLDYSIKQTLNLIGKHVYESRKNKSFSDSDLKKMALIYDKMIQAIFGTNGFLENKKEYGQGKDAFRVSPYNKFFSLADVFFSIGDQNPKTPNKISFKERLNFLRKLPYYFSIVPSFFKTFAAIIFKIQPKGDNAMMMNSINSAIRDLSELKGYKVTLIGEENLPKNSNKDDITFFTPSHRDAFKDMVSVAGLGVDNIIPFAAAGNFIPSNIKLGKRTFDLSRIKSFLIGRLNDNNGIIVVGNKNNPNPINPVAKFLRIIEQTKMRNFLIYPEGKLPDETGATGVVREKLFSADGPIAQAEQLGLKVNLVPISMRLNYLPNGNSNDIEIDVQPMIDDYTRKVITKLAGSDGMALLYRFGLTSKLITDKDLLFGQLRASRMDTFYTDKYQRNKSQNSKNLSYNSNSCLVNYAK